MPLRTGLLNEIENALGSATNANLSTSSAGADLYECYIWSLVLEAARQEGATIRLLDRGGRSATSFLVSNVTVLNLLRGAQLLPR